MTFKQTRTKPDENQFYKDKRAAQGMVRCSVVIPECFRKELMLLVANERRKHLKGYYYGEHKETKLRMLYQTQTE